MDSQAVLRQLLRAPSSYRAFLQPSTRPQSRNFALLAPHLSRQQRYITLPRIVQPSFWVSLIPKPLRRSPSQPAEAVPTTATPRPKERNPATIYIILGLLVGSQAIQILWLKRERDHFTRRAEAKIGVLREVIERVQKGEEVDVEKVLGTGDTGAEREWKEVLKEIEEEEVLFRSKKKRRAARAQRDATAQETERTGTKEEVQTKGTDEIVEAAEGGKVKVETYKGAKFY